MEAKLVTKIEGWRGDARLYHLSPPMGEHDYVIVSAVVVPFSGPETYIFAANKTGEAISYAELDGSFRGGLDHAEALRNAGYEVTEMSNDNFTIHKRLGSR